jgi:hypothetical protein
MAKKKTAKKKSTKAPDQDGRTPRKEPYGSERLNHVVERLREQAARISALARAMDDSDLGEVVIDGHAMLLRGLNQIDNFTDNASRAVREARTLNEEI